MFKRTEEGLQLHPIFRVLATAIIAAIIPVMAIAYAFGKLEARTITRIDQIELAQDTQRKTQRRYRDHQREMRKKLDEMNAEQKVLKQRFMDKVEADKLYQQRSEKVLDRIINKLDR